jgi:uncharacterized protein YndB with AHSA1/START domain
MTSAPTGRWTPTATGGDLVITRTFRAPIEDVWASVTEPDRTARWFGPWKGEARPGGKIQIQLVLEEGAPWSDAEIEACEAPHRLSLHTTDAAGSWHLELLLSAAGGVTELQLVHHLTSADGIGEVGPGWEFYLDALVASREDAPAPSFDDYYPAMRDHFTALANG